MMIGDVNGRVVKGEEREFPVGKFGEIVRNGNE